MKRFNKLIVMVVLALTVALGSLGVMTTAFAESYITPTERAVIKADAVETTLNQTETISFFAEGHLNVASFHVILVLPSNVTFSSFKIADNYQDEEYQYSVNGEEISIICNSGNETYASQTDLFSIEVCAREVGYGEIYFSSTSMTDVDANGIYCYGVSVAINVTGEEVTLLKGDVDGDDSVTVSDLMLMQRYVLGSLGETAMFSTLAADINGDGDINLVDCQQVKRYLVGKISIDELQALSGNGNTPENPDVPVEPEVPTIMTFDVYDGAMVLEQALTVNFWSGDTTFKYNEEELVGSSVMAGMIEETVTSNTLFFVPYSSSYAYEFMISDTDAKLESCTDLGKFVKDNGVTFDSTLAGDYELDNGYGGDVEVFESGVFHAYAYLGPNDGKTSRRALNGYISIEEDATYAYVFGRYKKEIVLDAENGIFTPVIEEETPDTKNQRFNIQYIYEDNTSTVVTAYYPIGDWEVQEVAKRLASENVPYGYTMTNYEVYSGDNGDISVSAWIRANSGSEGGDVGEGKQIPFFMLASDSKSQTVNPMGAMPVYSVEQLNLMLAEFSNSPEETGLVFEGVYVDKELKTKYVEDMGIDVDALYINFTVADSAGKLVSGIGGAYTNVKLKNTKTQEETIIDGATLTLNDVNSTFTFVIGDRNISGEAILSGGSYNPETGEYDTLELCLISNDEIQIDGILDFTGETPCFVYYDGIFDYSGNEVNEELKDIAGDYKAYITVKGMDMGYYTITLKDTGVAVIKRLYVKQIGMYEIKMTMTGASITIISDGAALPATIDFESRIIMIEVSGMGGDVNVPSGGGEEQVFFAKIIVVSQDASMENEVIEVEVYEDSYDALKSGIVNYFGDYTTSFTIYFDASLTEELTPDNFETVSHGYFLVFNSFNENGSGSGDITDFPTNGLN